MKVFITGGSGFIGGAVIEKLRDRHEFLAMSRSAASDAALKRIGAQAVRGDLSRIEPDLLRGCEAVVHCAAHIGPGGDRDYYWKINVEGTEQLVNAAKAAGVKRFVHLGTEAGCFYGQHMRDIDETCPLAPDSPYHYPATKAEAERRVLRANDPAHGFETISIRPRLVWGPGDRTLLPSMVKAARAHALVWIDGGRHQTSTTHVANVVRGVELALEGKGRGGEAYFVTDDEVRSFREIITALLTTQGLTPGRLSIPSPLVRGGVYLLQKSWEGLGIKAHLPINRFAVALMARDCTIRIDKARRELGFEPVISFSEGLKQLPKLQNDPA
ncbi:MAG: NAD-dependent epimerase/dehydratase family protein [Pseudomonadota bacterium]|nr:NAD-dependent epimerase/dehydratase family protein [Pseudomonadota bacterium]